MTSAIPESEFTKEIEAVKTPKPEVAILQIEALEEAKPVGQFAELTEVQPSVVLA